MNICTWNLQDCNSGQYIYVTGLHNFFVVLQDFIDRIRTILREYFFRETSFLLPSNTLCYKFFPMKISSLHWNGTRGWFGCLNSRKVEKEQQSFCIQIKKLPSFSKLNMESEHPDPVNRTKNFHGTLTIVCFC